MKLWILGSGALLALLFLAGCKLTRAGYESAGRKVVRRNEVMVRVRND